MTQCPRCGLRDSTWHRVLKRQMCNQCAFHWEVIRVLPGSLDLGLDRTVQPNSTGAGEVSVP